MAVVINDGKVSFSDYSLDTREEMMDSVLSHLGTSYAYDSYLDAVADRSAELEVDIRALDWEDFTSVADSVYDNAGEPLGDALFELAVIACYEGGMADWENNLIETLQQVDVA